MAFQFDTLARDKETQSVSTLTCDRLKKIARGETSQPSAPFHSLTIFTSLAFMTIYFLAYIVQSASESVSESVTDFFGIADDLRIYQ